MNDLISIIIPCYNAEKHIIEALKSVTAQSYKWLDIICVNDGSIDLTLNVIENYKDSADDRIKIITTKNRGVSAARNIGIKNAEGESILFLDADDILWPDCIKILHDLVKGMNCDTAYGYWTRKKEELGTGLNKNQILSQKEIMQEFIYRKQSLSFFNFLYKKSVLIENNIFFDEDLKYGEDNLFFWKYLCHISNGIQCNTALYWYRINDKSAMKNSNWRLTDSIISVKRAIVYMENIGFPFAEEFKYYMPSRTILAVAKTFALSRSKEMYERFCKEYDVKHEMKKVSAKQSILVKISAVILGISSSSFYFLMQKLYKEDGGGYG